MEDKFSFETKFRLFYAEKKLELIPSSGGIYFFKFVPPILFEDFIKNDQISSLYPKLRETAEGKKLKVNVELTSILSSGFTFNKNAQIEKIATKERKVIEGIWNHAKELVPPLYVGKANNLQKRLNQHLKRETQLLNDLENENISLFDISVGWIELDLKNNNELEIVEYMIQKMTSPILTKRYG